MMEDETWITVAGVILLGISTSLSISYILDKNIGTMSTTASVPFVFNTVVMLYIMYGLVSVSRLSLKIKVVIISLFFFLFTAELYFMTTKPETFYGIPVALGITGGASLLRLYLIISMHCDLPKSLLVQMAKNVFDTPRAETRVDVRPDVKPDVKPAGPAFDRVSQILSDALKRDNTKLTPEELLEQKNKLRNLYGLEPKVAMTGGRR